MKKYYRVSFKYSENVYCTNMVLADSMEDALNHYQSKYSWAAASEAKDHEVTAAKRKGMPLIEV